MEKKGVLMEKSIAFAVRIIRLYQHLSKTKKEFVLSKQILRSGTAIGAISAEGEYAQSVPDFINKHHQALKEANETAYWLLLLAKTGYISQEEYGSLSGDNNELKKMLIATVNTAKKRGR